MDEARNFSWCNLLPGYLAGCDLALAQGQKSSGRRCHVKFEKADLDNLLRHVDRMDLCDHLVVGDRDDVWVVEARRRRCVRNDRFIA